MAEDKEEEPTRNETPAAARAFEDYWDMGEERSLPKLAVAYSERTEDGQAHALSTLKEWSSVHGWQERVKQRDAEAAAERRAALNRRATRFRAHLLDGLETDIRLKLQELQSGSPVLVQDANGLDKMAKLYFQLAEQPLVDAQSIGLHGVEDKPPVAFAHLTAEEAMAILGNGGPYKHEGGDGSDEPDDGGADQSN